MSSTPPTDEPSGPPSEAAEPGASPSAAATTRAAGQEQDEGVKATRPSPPGESDVIAEDAVQLRGEGAGEHAAPTPDALLRVDDVVAGYVPGVNILNGLDFYVSDGELVGIIGPNGAGKSTLLKAIFGLIKVTSGTISLRGEDITGLKANRLVAKGVGFVPQTNNVFPSLTIEENLQMGVYQAPKKFKQSFEFVTALFPALADRRSQRAGSLSGGERQMVAMARALMMEPSVLLLDEPSAGLSPALQDEVFVRTRQINRAGVSVVMVEQNARRCLQICDRGYVLDQGRNAYTATGEDLINDPKVVELYLGTLAKG